MAWYRAGGGGIPASLKTGMNDVLNKKFGTSTTYAPAGWPDNVNLLGKLPEKTVSGAIAHITDGADRVPIKSWEVTLPASLDGYSEIGCTKNTVNFFNEDWEVGGINDGTGVPNSDTDKIRSKTFSIMKGGATYYAKAPNNIRVLFYASDYSFISETVNIMNTTFTAPSNCVYFKIRGTVAYGTTYNNDISINASGDTDYAPYEAPTTATVSLGRTIYGGTADIVNGTGSEKYKLYTASDVTSLYWNAKKAEQVDTNHRASFRIALSSGYITINNSLCNELSYSQSIASGSGAYEGYQLIATAGIYFCIDLSDIGMENATSSTPDEDFLAAIRNYGDNLKFVVELSTPTDFTFTPITPTPETALGVNNFWADEGDTEVTYRGQGTVTVYPNAEDSSF